MGFLQFCAAATRMMIGKKQGGTWYSFRRTHIMPESEYKRKILKNLQEVYKYKYFIETGTYMGDTPISLRDQYEKIYTIELSKELYDSAKEKLKKYNNIIPLYGDSSQVLKDVIPQLDASSIFFLDGHYSGGTTAIGSKTHPIIEELKIISGSDISDHIIVIDDISDFTASEDNVSLSKVMKTLESINPNYKFYSDYDMLFALPFENTHRQFWREIAPYFVIR